jgi:thiol-disulfide isomerase/thioredoxin
VIGRRSKYAAIAAPRSHCRKDRTDDFPSLFPLRLHRLFALLVSLPASAAEWKPFSAAAFTAAQKEGKSILVDIFAPWCPVCRAQAPILENLTAEPKFNDLVVLKVDRQSAR